MKLRTVLSWLSLCTIATCFSPFTSLHRRVDISVWALQADPGDNTSLAESTAIRLNKVFKATHSRRQADDLIASGRVTINDKPAESFGIRVIPFRDVIKLDGQPIQGWEILNGFVPTTTTTTTEDPNGNDATTAATDLFEYVKYWKPIGVTCTADRSNPSNIIDALEKDGYQPKHRVFSVGRLDKDSSGLIVMTSDGRLPNAVLQGRHKQPKSYDVLVDYPLRQEEIDKLRNGVFITTQAVRDGKHGALRTAKTLPCLVEESEDNPRLIRMTIFEGRNRQVRKMIASLGYKVVLLHRTTFMGIGLHPLKGPGDWKRFSNDELDMVTQVLANAQPNERMDP